MSIKYRIKTINKNENQLVISGAVKASVPEDLSFQLTGEQGREIPCSVGLSKNPLNGDALFAIVASSIEEATIAKSASPFSGFLERPTEHGISRPCSPVS